ncbi:C-1-tetrahydrofolate synthase, mitochondrial [Nakaseomyces glabratus]|nr:C-1-tetrahydrofolate synthase, mitochondrial [Nakaseomyces glabratus]KTB16560.1 C-1-tetrahydrofolate synthase, mitochondrial [Nakaseomyces glabratus]OXB40267.1 hypothetical protein B1J91_M01694g [Nakaseomyces glabratus]OXB45568.1 hypothetical protein B1J92_M01694g [Nakaseomyces glabratus]
MLKFLRTNRYYHLLSGTKLSQKIIEQCRNEIDTIRKNHKFLPTLKILQVGNRLDSSAYVNMKLKKSEQSGVKCIVEKLPESITEFELLSKIEAINNDTSIHGLLIQLPLPKHLDETTITSSVSVDKDVDGFHIYNAGELTKKNGHPKFIPCTPNGCIELLKEHNITIAGKNAVVIGRSSIVGTPITSLLKNLDATVTQCHSKTVNLPEIVKTADIVIAACGQANMIKGEWLKEGAVVIDVGINHVPDNTKKSGHRLVGDVDFDSASKKASYITPVPGGVGQMTVAMLVSNVVLAAKRSLANFEKVPEIKPLPLKLEKPVPSDFEISKSQEPKHIDNLAKELGIFQDELELHGHYKGKISTSILDRLESKKNGKYVLVAGITPTPLGEGKSTTTMGLVQALTGHLGKPSIANVRQPSMGPTFGVKGGAAGGGYAQVIPMDQFNLHLTGDIHAVGVANNLLAAAIDTRMLHESTIKNDAKFYDKLVPKKNGIRSFSPAMTRRLERLGINKTNPDELTAEEINKFVRLNINPDTINIKRVVDVNDRMLRKITIGQAATEKGRTRETGFDITVASELMAILALSTSLQDMKRRVSKLVVASDINGKPVTVDDIGCSGAIVALMTDTIKPNLMQTLEGSPVLVHAGPFANISIGASSVMADKIALKLMGTCLDSQEPGYVVTEAGFDFSMGGERFFNIKCRSSGLVPDTVVLVATVRAIKSHGGAPDVKPGQALPQEYIEENIEFVKKGVANLVKQIENVKKFGVPVVVAINKFSTDTENETKAIEESCKAAGANNVVVSNHWEEGGKGAIDLANAVVQSCEEPKSFQFLYDTDLPIKEKLETIVKEMYGGAGIELSEKAQKQIALYTEQGFDKLPICIAKTQYSLSHDPKLKGVPQDFIVPIRDIRASIGAGYLYALAAEIQTIPGLSVHAGYLNVEVDDKGNINGLF